MAETVEVTTLAEAYCRAVEGLGQVEGELAAEAALACLVKRDQIAYLVKKNGPAGVEAAQQIARGDQVLKPLLPAIGRLPELKAWRTSFEPAATAWWWPEPPKPPPGLSDRFNWLWTALALALLALSLSLIADIAARFLSGDTDALGIFAVVGPALLTLFTTRSVLTQAGQELARRMFGSLKFIPSHLREELGALMSALLLALVAGLWYALPDIAVWYNEWGLESYRDGEFSSAKAGFERALKLDPDYVEARYNLGALHEALNELEQAREHYQLAVQGGQLDAAYNNLARLHILAGAYDQAVPLLLAVVSKKLTQADSARYTVNKNLGWARLGQGRYSEALPYLEEAIQLDPERAPAYCLKAQVLTGLPGDYGREIEDAWLACRSLADLANPDEDYWFGLSQQYFLEQAARDNDP